MTGLPILPCMPRCRSWRAGAMSIEFTWGRAVVMGPKGVAGGAMWGGVVVATVGVIVIKALSGVIEVAVHEGQGSV